MFACIHFFIFLHFFSYSPLTVCASVHFYTLDNYDAEGYNPESPGLTVAGRNPYRQFIPRVQTQRSNLIGLTSSEGQGSRGNNLFYSVFFNSTWSWEIDLLTLIWLLAYLLAANIVIQTEPATAPSTPGSNVSRFNTEQDSRKRTMGPSTAEGPAPKKPWMEK